MSYVASRLSVVKPSVSMAASQAAKALCARGVDVIELSSERRSSGVNARRRLWTVTLSTATGEEMLTEAIARINAAVAHVE